MYVVAKCKKCRKTLFDKDSIDNLRDIHYVPLNSAEPNDCELLLPGRIFAFVTHSWLRPSWIVKQIDYGNISKSKIICPFCKVKIGSFNAEQRRMCKCGKVVPICYIIENRIDLIEDKDGKD